jgi:hypothetical protein
MLSQRTLVWTPVREETSHAVTGRLPSMRARCPQALQWVASIGRVVEEFE